VEEEEAEVTLRLAWAKVLPLAVSQAAAEACCPWEEVEVVGAAGGEEAGAGTKEGAGAEGGAQIEVEVGVEEMWEVGVGAVAARVEGAGRTQYEEEAGLFFLQEAWVTGIPELFACSNTGCRLPNMSVT
jgi:hypothetical protein